MSYNATYKLMNNYRHSMTASPIYFHGLKKHNSITGVICSVLLFMFTLNFQI